MLFRNQENLFLYFFPVLFMFNQLNQLLYRWFHFPRHFEFLFASHFLQHEVIVPILRVSQPVRNNFFCLFINFRSFQFSKFLQFVQHELVMVVWWKYFCKLNPAIVVQMRCGLFRWLEQVNEFEQAFRIYFVAIFLDFFQREIIFLQLVQLVHVFRNVRHVKLARAFEAFQHEQHQALRRAVCHPNLRGENISKRL